jgi:hypothetical protein
MTVPLRRTARACRACVVTAAAVLLFAACGDSGDDTSPADVAAESDEADATGGGSEADFCTQAAGIDQRVEEAMSDAGGEDPSVASAFREIAEELRAIEAPSAISSDWSAMAGGLDRMADALAEVDLTDPGSLSALEEAEGGLSEASSNVEDYLRDECGIEP